MRLFRTEALDEVEPPSGGYEAESRHLRALLASGHDVAAVEIPTVYDGEPSHFRPVRDTAAVASALLAPLPDDGPSSEPEPLAAPVLRAWGPRLAASMGAVFAIAAALPALQPLDNQLFLAVNGLGDGPEWLYRAFDPHTRNYILLLAVTLLGAAAVTRRVRYVIGAGLAVLLAGYLAGAALEVLKLFVERARPRRCWDPGAAVARAQLVASRVVSLRASDRDGGDGCRRRHGGSGPAETADRLCGRDRVHPRPVRRALPPRRVVGAALGYELGLFSAGVMANARLLPQRWTTVRPLPEPARLHEARR